MRIPSAALAAALISICAFASTSQAVPANPCGLSPGTAFHFRLVLTSCGITQFGEDLALRTTGGGEVAGADQPAGDASSDATADGGSVALDSVAVTPQTTAVATVRAAKTKKARKARRHRRARHHH